MVPLWICLWTFHNSMTYFLTWGKKRKEREKKKKKPPANFKSLERVPLVFLDATGWGGLVFTFLPFYYFWGWGPGLGHNIQSCLACSPCPPWAAGPPLSICARPAPLIHQLCWGPCSMLPSCSLQAHCGRSPLPGKQHQPVSWQVSSTTQPLGKQCESGSCSRLK